MSASAAHAPTESHGHFGGAETFPARATLDRLPTAVLLVVAPTGQVAFANSACFALLAHRDGMRLRSSARRVHLILWDREQQQRFDSLVASVAGRCGAAHAFAGLRVARPSSKPDYVVQIAALESLAATHQGMAAVFITDPCEEHRLDTRLLESVYNLTSAEIRIAEGLLGDQPLCQIATTLGIRESTARSQLLSLFRKTRTSRQAQLVKLLMALRLWI